MKGKSKLSGNRKAAGVDNKNNKNEIESNKNG